MEKYIELMTIFSSYPRISQNTYTGDYMYVKCTHTFSHQRQFVMAIITRN